MLLEVMEDALGVEVFVVFVHHPYVIDFLKAL